MGDSLGLSGTPRIPDVADLTISRIRRGLEAREFTCRELCDVYRARIAEVNGTVNAIIQTNPEIDDIVASRDQDYADNAPRGSLHGVPIVVKNVFHVSDSIMTTAGSLALAGISSPISTAVKKLQDQGAVILGTTNLSEFANLRSEHCADGWSPLGGQCYGVYAESQNPSGSSSGSAVAVRLGLAAGSLGTENNGSITSPAAQAAAVGLKPTVGLVSRHGVIAFNIYQDCPGPITRTVEDAAALLSVIAGPDKRDSLTESIPEKMNLNFDDTSPPSLKGLRFAVPRATVIDSIDDEAILARFDAVLDQMRQVGATIVDNVEYPSWTRAFSGATLPFVWNQLESSLGEYLRNASSNPHRLGSLSDVWKHMQSLSLENTSSLGGTRFIKALNTPPMDAEANFRSRFAKGAEIATILEQHNCDAIVVPEGCRNPSDLGQSPIICLPLGFHSKSANVERDEHGLCTKAPNMPFGLMFLGKKWDDKKLLTIGSAYQREIWSGMRDLDKPIIMPMTELRDVVRLRQEKELSSSKPQL